MMITWNILRKRAHGNRGLAIGFGIPLGAMPPNVLPGWGIAITPEAPTGVSFDEIQAARRGTEIFLQEEPLILFGLDGGAMSVRAVLLSHVTPPPWGVLVAGDVTPRAPWEGALLWEPLLERVREGLATLVLSTRAGSEWAGILEGLGLPTSSPSVVIHAKDAEVTPTEYLSLLTNLANGPKTP